MHVTDCNGTRALLLILQPLSQRPLRLHPAPGGSVLRWAIAEPQNSSKWCWGEEALLAEGRHNLLTILAFLGAKGDRP